MRTTYRNRKIFFPIKTVQILKETVPSSFRSDAPGIIQYHFAFDEIIPIYALIMIKIHLSIKT